MANWLVFVSLIAAALSVSTRVAAATLSVATLAPNDLVITEYLANPVGIGDTEGEYIEIFNATAHTLDLDGLVVRDRGSNSFTVSDLDVAPFSFAVLSSGDGTALGFTPDYIYGSGMALTNGEDEIGLFRPDDQLISEVAWSDGDFFGAGIAHELALLDPATPSLLTGPAAGADFIAATDLLLLDNAGSPGDAGNTEISLATVPVPASLWLFSGALGLLGLARRSARLRARHRSCR